VTGPDEYTTLVDNNTYTNLMARENLAFAAEIAGWLRRSHHAEYRRIAKQITLADGEPGEWKTAAKKMVKPQAVAVEVEPGQIERIIPQDDTFLTRPRWDEDKLGDLRGERPLLLRYHPLVYNRYQVSKQADLILAEFLLGHEFDAAQKKRDFDYYEARTTHDSSLSRCIFSIMAAELANPDDPHDAYLQQAADFYRASATIDLDNHRDETKKGIHAANMGGSWMGIVFGFAHLRASRDRLALRPVFPPGWTSYSFRVFYQGRCLQVQVERTDHRPTVTVTLLSGDPLDVEVYGSSC
jgi:alpha,alpha-trehalose phosphorylase